MSRKTYKHTLHACYRGFITQAIVLNLAPLLFVVFLSQFHTSYEELGRLVLVTFGIQILADILCARYADRTGHRRLAVIAHALCTVGLLLLGWLPQHVAHPYAALKFTESPCQRGKHPIHRGFHGAHDLF